MAIHGILTLPAIAWMSEHPQTVQVLGRVMGGGRYTVYLLTGEHTQECVYPFPNPRQGVVIVEKTPLIAIDCEGRVAEGIPTRRQ